MDSIEVPEYFICPISLQIMKDPVTTLSGITYDRDSIERWLFKSDSTICPVTQQPLSRGSDLTPNHTLRRLIQSWCTSNASNGIDQIPTRKPPLSKFYIINLVRDLYDDPPSCNEDNNNGSSKLIKALQKLEALALENERNRVSMVEAGLIWALLSFVVSCYKNWEIFYGMEEALSILYMVRRTMLISQSIEPMIGNNEETVVDSFIWILGLEDACLSLSKDKAVVIKSHVAHVLKALIQKVSPTMIDRLKPEFFTTILSHTTDDSSCPKAKNALLRILSETASFSRNRAIMIQSNAVFHLIELELKTVQEKNTTELVFRILASLCSCADGRAQLLEHAAGIAFITKRILKVSSTVDDRALLVIWLICKYSATNGALQEMLKMGTVAKICMVMQANCGESVKEKGRDVLRMHMDLWKGSPDSCVEMATLTRFAAKNIR